MAHRAEVYQKSAQGRENNRGGNWQEAISLLSEGLDGQHNPLASSLSTEFPLDAANRVRLWEEVKAYWDARPKQDLDSHFFDRNWR